MAYRVIRPATHEEWLDERKKGIGSSEAGTVMGVKKGAVAWISSYPRLNFGYKEFDFNPEFFKAMVEQLEQTQSQIQTILYIVYTEYMDRQGRCRTSGHRDCREQDTRPG